MVKLIVKNYIKADKVDVYISLAKKLVYETNQNDIGCIHYELYQDTTNPQIVTIMEEWESKEALDQHMAAKHFTEIVPLFSDCVEKPGETNFYQKLA